MQEVIETFTHELLSIDTAITYVILMLFFMTMLICATVKGHYDSERIKDRTRYYREMRHKAISAQYELERKYKAML